MSQRYAGYSSTPYWPFGPGETEEWQRLLKERPDLAPAVRKLGDSGKASAKRIGNIAWQMEKREAELREGASDAGNGIDDGLAKAEAQPELCRTPDGDADWLELANTYRSERLQALGNGVVPLTAALAFSVLWERMKERNYG